MRAIAFAGALLCVSASFAQASPRRVSCDDRGCSDMWSPSVAQRRVGLAVGAPVRDAAVTAQRAVYGAGRVLGSRPAGCPRAWCGCWLGINEGMRDRSLWVARNWSRVGRSAGGPRVGAYIVWPHHVGKITAVDGYRVRVLSGNDGGRIRDRWRSAAGVIAYRVL